MILYKCPIIMAYIKTETLLLENPPTRNNDFHYKPL